MPSKPRRHRPRLSSLLLVLAAVATVRTAPAAAQPAGTLEPAVRLFEAHDYAAAKAQLAQIARAEPTNAPASYYLGRIALVDGNADEAARLIAHAIALDPRNSAYHQWLGRAYARQAQRAGRFKQLLLAKKIHGEFETAIALDPDNVSARRDMVQYYLIAPRIAGGSVDRARAQAREIASRNPMLARVAAGQIAEASDDLEAAEREYRAAIAEYPDSGHAYVALGALYQRAQRYDEAFEVYERLVKVNPGHAGAHYQIGRTASLSGTNLERGERALKAYLAMRPGEGDPPLASAQHRLGMIYELQGRGALARSAYAAALHLDPRHEEARVALAKLN